MKEGQEIHGADGFRVVAILCILHYSNDFKAGTIAFGAEVCADGVFTILEEVAHEALVDDGNVP